MFQELFVRPIFNILVAIYEVLPVDDLGIAVIVVVLLIRFILLPLSRKATATQIRMQVLQPEIQALQKRYKDDKETQTKATLQLYRDHKLNPFSGILILFAQLPILIALYKVFLQGVLQDDFSQLLYGFLPNPGALNSLFLGFIDLAKPFLPLVVISAAIQFFQTKMITPAMSKDAHSTHSTQTMMARQMLYIGPVMTLAILWTFPSVIALYWSVTSLWSIGEQHFLLKKSSKKTMPSSEKKKA